MNVGVSPSICFLLSSGLANYLHHMGSGPLSSSGTLAFSTYLKQSG